MQPGLGRILRLEAALEYLHWVCNAGGGLRFRVVTFLQAACCRLEASFQGMRGRVLGYTAATR